LISCSIDWFWDFLFFVDDFFFTIVIDGWSGFVRRNLTRSSIDNDGNTSLESNWDNFVLPRLITFFFFIILPDVDLTPV
jgi:hypothetical protein